MNETAVFEGRRSAAEFHLSALGIFMLGFGFACLGIGAVAGRQTGEYVCLAPGALLAVLGAACLMKARNRPNTRMVIVEPMGVRFIAEGRPQWAIPWTAIRALGTKRNADQLDVYPGPIPSLITGWESGYRGLFFAVGNDLQRLRLGDDFGPEKALRELFRHLARQAAQRNIPVEDGLGWGRGSDELPRRGINDRLLSTGVLIPPEDLDSSGYQDAVHSGKHRLSPGPAIALVFGMLGAGLILAILGTSPYGISGPGILGILFTALGLLLGPIVLIGAIRSLAFVAFNRNGLSIRGGLGKWTALRWDQVCRCKLDVDTRRLTIYSDLGKWTGVLDENVMLALCKSFTRATGRPAETWSSGAEAYIGAPARNIN